MDEDSNPENIEDIIHSSMDGFRIANMIPQPSYLLHQESFSEHDTLTNNSSQNNLSQALLEGEEMVARRIHQIYPHIHVEVSDLLSGLICLVEHVTSFLESQLPF